MKVDLTMPTASHPSLPTTPPPIPAEARCKQRYIQVRARRTYIDHTENPQDQKSHTDGKLTLLEEKMNARELVLPLVRLTLQPPPPAHINSEPTFPAIHALTTFSDLCAMVLVLWFKEIRQTKRNVLLICPTRSHNFPHSRLSPSGCADARDLVDTP